MKLLIHDFSEQEWKKEEPKYRNYEIISDDGRIKPCTGCFGCWLKNPGECLIKDGYEQVCTLFHKADEILVVSRYTYGGFSSFVKNVFDRCIGGVLPFLEMSDGEMHHKRRYAGSVPMRFVFRGAELTDEDRERVRRYVKAVCRNLKGTILSVGFTECDPQPVEKPQIPEVHPEEKTILLNCSLRGDKANSRKILDRLSQHIDGKKETLNLSAYLQREDELAGILLSASKIVLGMPLYVDGIPSQALRIMEKIERYGLRGNKTVYAVANMGFYESVQIRNLLSMVRTWCRQCGYEYGGGLAAGAGEMMGNVMNIPGPPRGPARNMLIGLEKLGNVINASGTTEDIYTDAHRFPRFLYMLAANWGWPAAARKNGLKKRDLYRQR